MRALDNLADTLPAPALMGLLVELKAGAAVLGRGACERLRKALLLSDRKEIERDVRARLKAGR
jgi:hypothetical protein